MSRSWPYRPSRRACGVIGAQHEALLRSIGGNPCEYCSKRGSVGCAWETTTARTIAIAVTRPAPAATTVVAPAHSGPRGQSVRHHAAEVASHLGP